MTGTVVGVLRGGVSLEHDISLKSGHAVLQALPAERYHGRDIFIDKNGAWFDRGRAVSCDRALRHLDAAIITLHGESGEDGRIQRLLAQYGIPYVGAESFGAFISMHKLMAKMHAKELGFLVPDFRYVGKPEDADTVVRDAVRSFHQPVVVKPVDFGSSHGISIAGGYAQVFSAVEALFAQGTRGVLIEERIHGVEATVGVIEQFRGERLYALPTVEIIPPPNDFFSYGAKYSGESSEITPGRFSRMMTEDMQHIAKRMHAALHQRHYSRSDFIVTERGPYFLELNTAAAVGLTPASLLPKALSAVGVHFEDFLAHLVDLALKR